MAFVYFKVVRHGALDFGLFNIIDHDAMHDWSLMPASGGFRFQMIMTIYK